VVTEILGFLCEQLELLAEPAPTAPVRVYVGGGGGWRDLTDWPPPDGQAAIWTLSPGGGLSIRASPVGEPSAIRYDPADPTPSRGGATLGRPGGVVENGRIEARSDVLVFTSAPLKEDLEIIGPVSARLMVRVAGLSGDAFIRLCDVDADGASRNVCDGIVRPDPYPHVFGADGGVVAVPMSSAAHRFAAGHRIRVQVSGGSHPRFARNTGTGEPVATARNLAPVSIQLLHRADTPTTITLPVQARIDGG
jgi:putative CocE/NonD family hydrolase